MAATLLPHTLFWLSLLLLAYTYAGYPWLMQWLAKGCKPPASPPRVWRGRISVVLAARNEQATIRARLQNLLDQAWPPEDLEILVINDGSADATTAEAQALADPRIQVLEMPWPSGKAACLNRGLEAATGELVVFADARQRFAPDALRQLVAPFAAPEVGAVSGALEIDESTQGVGRGLDAYWRLEKKLRQAESARDSCIGCTGAIYAMRRALYTPLPEDTILDDVVTPMQVLLRGQRVLFAPAAVAWDGQPLAPARERVRKRRTLAGNFQMLCRYPEWLLPWRNRCWWQLISHKYLRLAGPPLLLTALLTAWSLRTQPLYGVACGAQVALYLAAAWGGVRRTRHPLLAVPAGFLFLQGMVMQGAWDFLTQSPQRGWRQAPEHPRMGPRFSPQGFVRMPYLVLLASLSTALGLAGLRVQHRTASLPLTAPATAPAGQVTEPARADFKPAWRLADDLALRQNSQSYAPQEAFLARLLAGADLALVRGALQPTQREAMLRLLAAHFTVRSTAHDSWPVLKGLMRQMRLYHCLPERLYFECMSTAETVDTVRATLGPPGREEQGDTYRQSEATALYTARPLAPLEVFVAPEELNSAAREMFFFRPMQVDKTPEFPRVPLRWLEYPGVRFAMFARENEWRLHGFEVDTAKLLGPAEPPPAQEPVRFGQFAGDLWSMALSPDGRRLALGSHDGVVRLLDIGSRQVRMERRASPARIAQVVFSPDGRTLLTTGYDGALRLWDVQKGEETKAVFPTKAPITAAAFSPDGKCIVFGGLETTLVLWDVQQERELMWYLGHEAGVSSVAFSPNGQKIVSGSADYSARVWDRATGRELQRLRGHTTGVQSVAFSPDGAQILTSSGGTTLAEEGKLMPGWDATLRLWDATSGEEKQRLAGHEDWVVSAAFSPDGRYVVSGSGGNVAHGQVTMAAKDNSVRVWDVQTGREVGLHRGHHWVVSRALFAPDGSTIFSCSWDGTVQIMAAPKR